MSTKNPILVVHHTRGDGGSPVIDIDWSMTLLYMQMDALNKSGLTAAASKLVVGMNGSTHSAIMARSIIPEKAELIHHPQDVKSELPTLCRLREWLPGHEDWYVFYHHAKGVTYPKTDRLTAAWRHCMTKHLVYNWRICVADMDAGYEAVGCHWLTPEKYSGLLNQPYFGGNWWWAKAGFLKTLPAIPETAHCRNDFFIAEKWIGSAALAGTGKTPIARDYHPEWPNMRCDQQ